MLLFFININVIIKLPHNVMFAHIVDMAGGDLMFLENSIFQKGGLPTETGCETHFDMETQMHSKH